MAVWGTASHWLGQSIGRMEPGRRIEALNVRLSLNLCFLDVA